MMPFSYDNLGGALLEEGMTNDAIADFRKALQIQPDCMRWPIIILATFSFKVAT